MAFDLNDYLAILAKKTVPQLPDEYSPEKVRAIHAVLLVDIVWAPSEEDKTEKVLHAAGAAQKFMDGIRPLFNYINQDDESFLDSWPLEDQLKYRELSHGVLRAYGMWQDFIAVMAELTAEIRRRYEAQGDDEEE